MNQRIQSWREELSRLPEFRPDNLNEMEAHLRESIENLQKSGLSGEEAFLIATQRLGSAGALAPEFRKVNARNLWMSRAMWMLAGIQLASLIMMLTRAATGWVLVGGSELDPNRVWIPTVGMVFSWVFMLSLIGLTGWCLYRGSDSTSTFIGKFFRHPVLAMIVLIALPIGLQAAGIYTALLYLNQGTQLIIAQEGWTALGTAVIQTFLIPIALACLAQIQLRSETSGVKC